MKKIFILLTLLFIPTLFIFSQNRSIAHGAEPSEIYLTPNPATNQITISSATPFHSVEIINFLGKRLFLNRLSEIRQLSIFQI